VKIAILGSKGMPVNYGGFETLAEEVSTRLVKKGHEVTVYCCRPYIKGDEDTYKGVRLVILPTVRLKGIERPLYELISLLHASFLNAEVVLVLGPSPFCFLPRLFKKKVVINIDRFVRQQKKSEKTSSWYLRFSEQMSGNNSDAVVTSAKWMQEYYKKQYDKDSIYIAYGSDLKKYPPGEMLRRFGLEQKGYILYAGPFEPANNPLMVREAFDELGDSAKKLVMVGDVQSAGAHAAKVKETTNPHIVFTGAIFRKPYKELLSNAYLYIQASETGGTHPELVEAMGVGGCVLATDLPEHREILGDAGVYYRDKEDLRRKMAMLMKVAAVPEEKGKAAAKKAVEEYSWDKVAERYEMLFKTLTAKAEPATEGGHGGAVQ